MGRLAVTAAAGIAGFAIGGPAGAQVGILIGGAVGGLLFPEPTQRTEGPRVEDLGVTTSAYGKPLPIYYGTGRASGEMVWLKNNEIEERRNTEKVGGGKSFGGGGAEHTEYIYFGSFAISLGEGPATAVRRLWADGKLVYDASGANEVVKKEGLAFRFYPGDDVQLPDPAYQADVGAANAPALRGITYIVFEDLALADFGNRVPNITAELVFATGALSNPVVNVTSSVSGNSPEGFGIGYLRDHVFWTDDQGTSQGTAVLHAGDDTIVSTRTGAFGSGLRDYARGIDLEGCLLMDSGAGLNTRFEPFTMTQLFASVATQGFPLSVSPFALVTPLGIFKAIAGHNNSGAMSGSTAVRFWDHDLLTAHSDWQPFLGNSRPRAMTVRGEGSGRFVYKIFDASDLTRVHLYEYRIVAEPFAPAPAAFDLGIFGTGIEEVDLGSIAVADIDALGGSFVLDTGNISHDRSDDSLIISLRLGSDHTRQYVVKWREDLGIVWKAGPLGGTVTATTDYLISLKPNGSFNRLEGDSFAWINHRSGSSTADLMTQIRLSDGAIQQDAIAFGVADGNNDDSSFYDDRRNWLFNVDAVDDYYRVTVAVRAEAEATLADIITDQCRRAGLDPATQVNATAVTDTIAFYAVTREASARRNIEPLLGAYFIDGVEEDGALVFRPRGGAPEFTLKEADMEVVGDSDPLTLTKVQALELPERMSLIYLDKDNDFNQGNQSAKRILAPLPAMRSRGQATLQIPGGMTATQARRIAHRMLTSAWNERDRYKGRPAIDFIEYSPGEVGTLERLDGSTQRVRLLELDLGADWSLEASFVAEDPAQFASEIEGDTGRINQQVIQAVIANELFLLNLPILRDIDGGDRTVARPLWGAAPVADKPWPGALLYRVIGDTEFAPLGQTLTALAYGRVTALPADPLRPWRSNPDATMDFHFVVGSDRPQSVSKLDMLNGANNLFVFKAATGRGAVIGFESATDLGGGKVRVQGLLPGRRGTEVSLAGIALGDSVVLLERAALDDIAVELANVGAVKDYRAVTFGDIFERGTRQAFTATGEDLKPWALTNITALQTGGGSPDIQIKGFRRPRYNHRLFKTPPLNEDAALFELDILDGPGGTVVRPVTGLATPNYTYLNADIVADLGAVPATLYFNLYQISGQVGRGLAVEQALATLAA